MSKAPSHRWPILLSMIVSAVGACKKVPPPPPDRATTESLGGSASSGTIGIDGGGAVDANRAAAPAPPPSASTAPLARPAPLSAADEEAIARAMCGPGPMRQVAKSWTCHCPSYTDFGGTDASEGQDLQIYVIHPGRFSAADREEAVLGIAGCESGATSALSYGAHALVRRAKSGWYRIVYESGGLGDCTAIVSVTGLSRLICRQDSGHMGLYRHQISLLSYVQKPGGTEERTQEIFAFATNSPEPAVFGPDFKGELRILTEKRFEILGALAYSAGDNHALSIEVEVESQMKCVGPLSGCPHAALATALHPLTFTFDGRAFAVAPGSRRQLELLRAREAE
jgi:hypothetical protein